MLSRRAEFAPTIPVDLSTWKLAMYHRTHRSDLALELPRIRKPSSLMCALPSEAGQFFPPYGRSSAMGDLVEKYVVH